MKSPNVSYYVDFCNEELLNNSVNIFFVKEINDIRCKNIKKRIHTSVHIYSDLYICINQYR